MARRMDRYNLGYEEEAKRSNKNQELYQNIGTNKKYTNFVDVRKTNAYLIDDNNKSNNYTRENYQHMKEYTNITPKTRVRKEFDDFNHLYHTDENRVYDINSVLEKARQQRGNSEEEALRKLKNTNYNILASINPKELEKYRQEKKNRLKPEAEEGLKELIDTMISKTLAGEISKEAGVDLLSDLMATNAFDRINMPDIEENSNKKVETNQKNLINDLKKEKGIEVEEKKVEPQEEKSVKKIEEPKKDVLDNESIKKLEKESKKIPGQTDNEIMKDLDQSFYTKSMDLSDKDFFTGDEEEESKMPIFLKLLIFIIILVLIGVGVYFLYQSL